MSELKTLTSLEEHKDKYFGVRSTPKREQYEEESRAFMIAEMLKEERHLAKLTQAELAKKTGTQKSLIARLERGKVELSTGMLNVLYETGFGKSFSL